jgi:hypothetical protein
MTQSFWMACLVFGNASDTIEPLSQLNDLPGADNAANDITCGKLAKVTVPQLVQG